jgi:hypothetical protein
MAAKKRSRRKEKTGGNPSAESADINFPSQTGLLQLPRVAVASGEERLQGPRSLLVVLLQFCDAWPRANFFVRRRRGTPAAK